MGKGNDPNCATSGLAMLDPTEGLPARAVPKPLDWAHLAAIRTWPTNQYDVEMKLWEDGILDQDDTAQELLQRLPAGDPAAWKQMLDGYRCPHTGYTLSVPWPLPFDGGPKERENPGYPYGYMSVFCAVNDGDTPIGDVVLAVSLDGGGQPELRIGAMELRRWIHGDSDDRKRDDPTRVAGGFGATLIGHLEAQARALGVQRMSLHAVGGGCYAWASMGFGYDPREVDPDHYADSELPPERAANAEAAVRVAGSMRYKMHRMVEEGRLEASAIEAYDNYLAANGVPDTPAQLANWSQDITMISPETGRRVPVGHAAIVSTDWHGVKPL